MFTHRPAAKLVQAADRSGPSPPSLRKSRRSRESREGAKTNPETKPLRVGPEDATRVAKVGDLRPDDHYSDAPDQLAKRYDVTFDVNERAFKIEQVNDVLKTEIAQPTPIPEMNTRVGTILKKILDGSRSPPGRPS